MRAHHLRDSIVPGLSNLARADGMERLREWLPVVLGLVILILVLLGLEVPA